jgi:hypothetical protein
VERNVLVIRTDQMEETKKHLEHFGLVFVEEQHGKGPKHFACEHEGKVLEIYPVGKKTEGIEFL